MNQADALQEMKILLDQQRRYLLFFLHFYTIKPNLESQQIIQQAQRQIQKAKEQLHAHGISIDDMPEDTIDVQQAPTPDTTLGGGVSDADFWELIKESRHIVESPNPLFAHLLERSSASSELKTRLSSLMQRIQEANRDINDVSDTIVRQKLAEADENTQNESQR